MRVGFVTPSSKENFHPLKNQSLVALYLLTILDMEFPKELDLSLIDLRGLNEQEVLNHIPKNDLFLYSVTSTEYDEYENLVKNVKKLYPKAKNVAGGPHINLYPTKSLELFDAIALGEGEETIKEIVNDTSASRLKRVYQQEKKVDINAYPFPSRKFYSRSSIANSGILPGKYKDLAGTNVLFSRGCPYSCRFCANMTRGPVRFRLPELIMNEIEYLKNEYSVEALALKDDQSIPTNKQIARKSLKAIAKTNVKWRGQSRANGIDLDTIKLAKESGCVEIAVGIESVSQKVVDIINKKIDVSKAKKYLADLKKEGIDRRLLLILGLPGEPEDIADKTIDFIKASEPSTVLLSLFCPGPGSEFYNNAGKYGIKLDSNITSFRTAFGRFDENEKAHLTFEYEKTTPFGRSMSREKIVENYERVQAFLRNNGLNEY